MVSVHPSDNSFSSRLDRAFSRQSAAAGCHGARRRRLYGSRRRPWRRPRTFRRARLWGQERPRRRQTEMRARRGEASQLGRWPRRARGQPQRSGSTAGGSRFPDRFQLLKSTCIHLSAKKSFRLMTTTIVGPNMRPPSSRSHGGIGSSTSAQAEKRDPSNQLAQSQRCQRHAQRTGPSSAPHDTIPAKHQWTHMRKTTPPMMQAARLITASPMLKQHVRGNRPR